MPAALANLTRLDPALEFSAPTLLDLVSELSATGATDREVAAALTDLLATGRVRFSALASMTSVDSNCETGSKQPTFQSHIHP